MRIFTFLYEKMLKWAQYKNAPYYLYGLSFAESSVFPIPPDFMLAPMALAKPDHAWRYALWTTVASVLGGIFGYFIGVFAFMLVQPLLIHLGYAPTIKNIEHWFQTWGFWVMFVAGFAPIPYKLFTITAGAVNIAFLPFILGSFVGRGGRFFLVTALIRFGGEPMKKTLESYIELIGWLVLLMLVLGYLICKFY